jgi:hypothetical protein
MSMHVHGLTIDALLTAQMRALSVMEPVEVVDEATHTVMQVDGAGHVVPRPSADWLYRKAEW